MEDDDLARYRSRLEEERAALLTAAQETAGDRRAIELDQARVGRLSRMDAMQQQAMAVEADRRRQVRLRRVDAALQRIDDGEFGYCLRCGEAIAPKRLDVDPTSPLCRDCAG